MSVKKRSASDEKVKLNETRILPNAFISRRLNEDCGRQHKTMYHLIAKEKVGEQHIFGKFCNCNSFGVILALLNSQNFKEAITTLSKVQQV